MIELFYSLLFIYFLCYIYNKLVYNNIVINKNNSRNKTYICNKTNTFLKQTDEHEYNTLHQLSHIPEVINIIGLRKYKDEDYIVLPYLKDWSRLCDLTCSRELLILLFIKICKGLHKIHENDVLHCDVKPDNILVSYSFDIVFIDFELTGGTSGYIAPEIIHDKYDESIYTKQVDIWSLGMTLLNTYINDDTNIELYKSANLKNKAMKGIRFTLDYYINILINHSCADNIDEEMAILFINILKIKPEDRLNLLSIINELERINKLH